MSSSLYLQFKYMFCLSYSSVYSCHDQLCLLLINLYCLNQINYGLNNSCHTLVKRDKLVLYKVAESTAHEHYTRYRNAMIFFFEMRNAMMIILGMVKPCF